MLFNTRNPKQKQSQQPPIQLQYEMQHSKELIREKEDSESD
jgi:hypothetical protein